MFNNLIGNIKNKITELGEGNSEFQSIVDNANIIENLIPLGDLKRKHIDPLIVKDKNVNVREDLGTIVVDLIPANELYLELVYAKELKTKKEYVLILTNKCLWAISKEGYNRYTYDSLKIDVVKKNILSRVVNLSSFILEIFALQEETDNFINIINNPEHRNKTIAEKVEIYGENEEYRDLTRYGYGISKDGENNVRFYMGEEHKRYNIQELENYELLVDNSSIQEKKQKQNVRLTSTRTSCYEIKIRITPLKDGMFEIPILVPTTFSQSYSNTSDTYRKSMDFAREIMYQLDELNDNIIYGKEYNN